MFLFFNRVFTKEIPQQAALVSFATNIKGLANTAPWITSFTSTDQKLERANAYLLFNLSVGAYIEWWPMNFNQTQEIFRHGNIYPKLWLLTEKLTRPLGHYPERSNDDMSWMYDLLFTHIEFDFIPYW